MSLWGVRVVMGSPLEPLDTSFWDPVGVIFDLWALFWKLLEVILGALGGLLGSFGQPWAVFSVGWFPGTPRIDQRCILLGS